MRVVREFLDGHRARYLLVTYSPAFASKELGAAPELPGWQLVRTHLCKLDGQLVMVMLPSDGELDLATLASATGSQRAELATDEEVARRFPACEVGAVPPLGTLYSLPLYADDSLARADQIAFHGGKHAEVIAMRFRDFFGLVEPRLLAAMRR